MIDNLQAQAQEILDHLQTIDISDGSKRIVWVDNTPKELTEWFQKVTADYTNYSFSELDECYNTLADLCYLILEMDENAIYEDIQYRVYENEWADIYNHDLLMWIDASLGRADSVDEAIREGSESMFGAIQQAQQREREQMANSFLESLNSKVTA